MAMTGMDIQQVVALSKQMQAAAEQVRGIQAQLTSALQGTTWVGADKARFEGEWNNTHAPALQNVQSALEQASQAASRNAQEQEHASA